MGRIREPELQGLAEQWSSTVYEMLRSLGDQRWPPKKIRRGLFSRPEIIQRYTVDGPTQWGNTLVWAVSHTSRPSAFDDSGNLTKGEREFWIIKLDRGPTPLFSIEGAEILSDIAADRNALSEALEQAQRSGPRVEEYFGNKGPLSHR